MEKQGWTLYLINGEKIFAPGTTLANACENIDLPIEKFNSIEYYCKGEDDSFSLEYVPSEDVHRWKLKNAQQLYSQLETLHNAVFENTKTLKQWKDYLTFVMTKVKDVRAKQKNFHGQTSSEEIELDKIVEDFFKRKEESERS